MEYYGNAEREFLFLHILNLILGLFWENACVIIVCIIVSSSSEYKQILFSIFEISSIQVFE